MKTLVLLVLGVIIAACSESPIQTPDSPPVAASVSAGSVVATVTGSGHALCTDDGQFCDSQPGDRALRTFTLTAQVHEDGTARGKAQFNNRARNLAWKADIECVYIRPDKPNQAWIAGTLTRGQGQSDAPGGIPYEVGARVLFGVEDNGEGGGAAAPDRITGLGTVPEVQYQTLCNFPQFIPPPQLDFVMQVLGFDPVRGEIQVRHSSAD